jgi:hypothetical protein
MPAHGDDAACTGAGVRSSQPPMPPLWEVNEEFRTQRQQHSGDARPSLSAAAVAAVTRNVELL